ncbi:hypothetical protein VaNZ11_000711 [Volvox africanus]|uniref:Uncharacterized protein n=1 Tax=Volvox africanus TaxID=51714 RepID=A0ABQ5RP94_9CHLO|nr:hypothetical protein VaNZ11_000711 [Volvox africanus]
MHLQDPICPTSSKQHLGSHSQAQFSDNVNMLAILKTGPDATSELTHRRLMIGCLKWVWPFLLQIPMPENPERRPLGSKELEEAVTQLSSWTTPRLESFFCQMAARAAVHDALGLSMLRGLPAVKELRNAALERRPVDPVKVMEERHEAARMLGQRIQTSPWYDRAYRIHFPPVAQLREQRHRAAAAPVGQERVMGRDGLGRENEDSLLDRHALDEVAMRSDLMTAEAASRVAIIHGLAVSREGRLSCPVQSGALFAGLLPQDWPWGTIEATGVAAPLQPDGTLSISSYGAMMRAIVDQPSVKSLNDKLDAESVFAACANGQLQPWVRHVVMDHAEYIELLPPHLVEIAAARGHSGELGMGGEGGNDRASCGAPAAAVSTSACSSPPQKAGLLAFHPILWFRFTGALEYNQCRRLPHRAVKVLGDITQLIQDAADVLTHAADEVLGALRMEVTAWAGALLGVRDASELPSPAGLWDAGAALAPDTAGTIAGTSAAGVGRELGSSSSSSVPVPETRMSTPLLSGPPPQPESLKHALQQAIRLADALTTFGTSADVMTREVYELAGISLIDFEVQDLLDQGKAMYASLVSVTRQLASPEELSRAVRMQEVPALGPAQCSEREEDLEEKAERLEQQEEGHREGEKEAKDKMVDHRNEGSDAAVSSRQRSDSHQCRVGMASVVATGIGSDRLECTSLWKALECDALGPAGRQARHALADALRRKVAAVEATVALVQSSRPKTVERRNEELLRRLPVAVAASFTQPPAAVTAAISPSPHIDGISDSGSGGGVVLEPPAPAGWAAERLFDPELQHDVDSGLVLLPEADEDGHRVVHMAAKLMFPVAANAVVFKAIRPENLMAMVGWDDEGEPNVDVQYVALQGRAVHFPPGVQAVPGL